MNNYSKIYWLTRLDGINSLFGFICIACFVVSIAIVIGCLMSSDFDDFNSKERNEQRKNTRKKILSKTKWLIPIGIMFLLFKTFTPTKNEMLVIIAGGKTLDYVQKDTSLSKIPYQATTIISNYLDKTIKDLKSDK